MGFEGFGDKVKGDFVRGQVSDVSLDDLRLIQSLKGRGLSLQVESNGIVHIYC